jgi:hypothetical protein
MSDAVESMELYPEDDEEAGLEMLRLWLAPVKERGLNENGPARCF